MKELIYISAFFLFVTLSHALFLWWGKKSQGKSRIWKIHLVVNGILWLILLGSIALIQLHSYDFQPAVWIKFLGSLSITVGMVLIISSFKNLGFKRAMGQRFFFKEEKVWISRGVYAKLTNPMYDGFFLILLGFGLFFGIVSDFFLALLSFLLLNVFLASIENQKEV